MVLEEQVLSFKSLPSIEKGGKNKTDRVAFLKSVPRIQTITWSSYSQVLTRLYICTGTEIRLITPIHTVEFIHVYMLIQTCSSTPVIGCLDCYP